MAVTKGLFLADLIRYKVDAKYWFMDLLFTKKCSIFFINNQFCYLILWDVYEWLYNMETFVPEAGISDWDG